MQKTAAIVELAEWDPDDFFIEENDRVFIDLKDGANYFGRDPWNHMVLKGEGIAPYSGILFLKEGRVFLRAAEGQKITHQGELIDNKFVYSGEVGLLLECGPHKFRVIVERGRYRIEFTQ